MRIAVVDDERLIRKDLIYYLKDLVPEAKIEEADSGFAAVELANSKSFDIFFLDINLGDMIGTVLALMLQKTAPEAAVIFVTAYGEYGPQAFELNAVDYIMKPFNKERVDKALKKALQRKRLNSLERLEQEGSEAAASADSGQGLQSGQSAQSVGMDTGRNMDDGQRMDSGCADSASLIGRTGPTAANTTLSGNLEEGSLAAAGKRNAVDNLTSPEDPAAAGRSGVTSGAAGMGASDIGPTAVGRASIGAVGTSGGAASVASPAGAVGPASVASPGPAGNGKIAIHHDRKVTLMDPEDIVFIESTQRNCCVCCVEGRKLITPTTLTELERRLANGKFMRVHKSFIINLDHVSEIAMLYAKNYCVRMQGYEKTPLPVGRNQIKKLKDMFRI